MIGDGVDIATHLEGIANPGAICLSERLSAARVGSISRSAISPNALDVAADPGVLLQ